MVKRITLIILLFFLLQQASFADVPKIGSGNSAGKTQVRWEIKPGVGVGWIKLGMNVNYVMKSLGEPDSRFNEGSNTFYTYDNYGLRLGMDSSDRINSILVLKGFSGKTKYSTVKGLAVGSGTDIVYRTLGRRFDVVKAVISDGTEEPQKPLRALVFKTRGILVFLKKPKQNSFVKAVMVFKRGTTPAIAVKEDSSEVIWEIVPGRRIGRIELDMAPEDFVRILGQPKDKLKIGKYVKYLYPHKGIVITLNDQNKIHAVYATKAYSGNTKYITNDGLTVGSKMSLAYKSLGDFYETTSVSYVTDLKKEPIPLEALIYKNKGIAIYSKSLNINSIVGVIIIFPSGSYPYFKP